MRALELPQGGLAADICAGTGAFVPMLRSSVGKSGRVLALDFAPGMLALGEEKFGADAEWIEADAQNLPLESDIADGVTIGWGIRNIVNPVKGLQEAFRILKVGGRIAILETAPSDIPLLGPLSDRILRVATPWVGRRMGHGDAYAYLNQSTRTFMSPEEIIAKMKDIGFSNLRMKRLALGNIRLYTAQKEAR